MSVEMLPVRFALSGQHCLCVVMCALAKYGVRNVKPVPSQGRGAKWRHYTVLGLLGVRGRLGPHEGKPVSSGLGAAQGLRGNFKKASLKKNKIPNDRLRESCSFRGRCWAGLHLIPSCFGVTESQLTETPLRKRRKIMAPQRI